MIDQRLIEEMYDTARKSPLQGAQVAAGIYHQLLNMPVGERVSVHFEPGEEFIIKRTEEGYDIS